MMGQSDQISILLVEDYATARANIAVTLAGAGMAVEQAEDGVPVQMLSALPASICRSIAHGCIENGGSTPATFYMIVR